MSEYVEHIQVRLKTGEDSLTEFKELRFGDRSVISPNTEDFAGELVAFANTEGGTLFLGVNDRGEAQGIPDDKAAVVEGWVLNIATNNCDPPVRPILRKLRLPAAGGEALVMLVEVHKSLFVHRTPGGRWLVRVGSSKRDLTSQELPRLLQQRGRAFVFDEQAVMEAGIGDLDAQAMERFFGANGAISWQQLLRNTKVVVADESQTDHPTVAGLLAFGVSPRRHLPSAFLEAAVYRGTRLTSDDLIHSQAIDGVVAEQVDGATAFVDRFMLTPARRPLGREDYPQYSLGAIHEAVVNAVAHRDYSLAGAKIRLFLFADRLELYSPGALPNTVTLETMPYRVFTRNQLLVGFLSRLRSPRTGQHYLESRGEGVRRILEESERHSGRRPEYKLFDNELLLTIWAKPSPHEGH